MAAITETELAGLSGAEREAMAGVEDAELNAMQGPGVQRLDTAEDDGPPAVTQAVDGAVPELAIPVEVSASEVGAAAVALAAPVQAPTAHAVPATTGEGAPGVAPLGHANPPAPEPAPPNRSPAHYLWAVLIARIYEVFPLLCPLCGGQMRLIAFITEGVQIRKILDHIGVDSEPAHISPARGPPLWDDCGDAHVIEGVAAETDWDLAAQPAPDFEVDQRINW